MKHIFLLGYPIAHSLSPVMHNAALRAIGLDDWCYELLETTGDDLPNAVARLRADDCVGANVTIPHKETIIKWLDALGESARQIGAVNTVVKPGGQLIGENTDVAGFTRALRDAQFDPRGASAVILGAGGAARAVAFALGQAGARSITILNRTPSRAEALTEVLRQHFSHLALCVNLFEALTNADIVVNALAASASSDVSKLPMRPGAMAFDLAYRPAETLFMRDAAAAGARAVGGLGMLVYQAAAAFELWTGREAPVAVMFDAARQAMS